LWLAAAGLLLFLAGGLAIFWTSSSSGPAAPVEVTGAPKLAVDQAVIDEGYQKFDTPVRTAFRLRNIGDQPLQILSEPQVQLVEGC
jgi:hypothetical protein